MTAQLRSYVEAVKAWLDGFPIQYCKCRANYPDESDWADWIGDPGDEPYYDGEFWRVKPGEYMWVRIYQDVSDHVASVCGRSKEDLHIPFLGVATWISDPVLVKLS